LLGYGRKLKQILRFAQNDSNLTMSS